MDLGLTVQEKTYGEIHVEISMLRKENEELKSTIRALQRENRDLASFISSHTTFPSPIKFTWKTSD